MRKRFLAFLFFTLFFIQHSLNAQKDSIRWAYIESIVQYDADTRFAIFQVSTQPDLLSQVAELQKKIGF